jgi:hypothetical protein
MKLIIICVFGFFSISSFASEKTVFCKTAEKVNGWNGSDTIDYIYLKATVKEDLLMSPEVSGAYSIFNEGLNFDANISSNGNWVKFRYLEDAWHFVTVTFPINYFSKKKFAGFISIVHEDPNWRNQNLKLHCTMK